MQNQAPRGRIVSIPSPGPNFDYTFTSVSPRLPGNGNLRLFNLADHTGVVFEIGHSVSTLSTDDVRALRDFLTAHLDAAAEAGS